MFALIKGVFMLIVGTITLYLICSFLWIMLIA